MEQFRAAADGCLAAEPAASTVLLTVSESVPQRGPFAFEVDHPARFGRPCDADGRVIAAFVQSPPRGPDLSNATSNARYRRIGYRPVADHTVVEFT